MTPALVTIGAATVDRHYAVSNLPAPDGGAYAPAVTDHPGGVAANVASGAAHLGRPAGLLTRLGDDDFGETVRGRLADDPFDTSRVRVGPDTTTHCVILRDDDGTRSIVTAGDSVRNMRLRPADYPYLAAADAVFVTAYAPDRVHRTLLNWASESGFPPVVFDLSGPLSELDGRGARSASVDQWVETAELFVVGRVAAASYLGCAGADAAAELRERGVRRAAVTDGEAGATLVAPTATAPTADETDADSSLVDVPAFDVDVVDETGAGDAYVAGLIDTWLLGDRDPAAAGRFAAATAALACTAVGARGNPPTTEQVETFLARRSE